MHRRIDELHAHVIRYHGGEVAGHRGDQIGLRDDGRHAQEELAHACWSTPVQQSRHAASRADGQRVRERTQQLVEKHTAHCWVSGADT